jgi:hypothetical protein
MECSSWVYHVFQRPCVGHIMGLVARQFPNCCSVTAAYGSPVWKAPYDYEWVSSESSVLSELVWLCQVESLSVIGLDCSAGGRLATCEQGCSGVGFHTRCCKKVQAVVCMFVGFTVWTYVDKQGCLWAELFSSNCVASLARCTPSLRVPERRVLRLL